MLDTGACLTSKELVSRGFVPNRVTVPNTDIGEVKAMRSSMEHLNARHGSWSEARHSMRKRRRYDLVYGDFCCHAKTVIEDGDIANLFRWDLLASRAVLAFTVCGRGKISREGHEVEWKVPNPHLDDPRLALAHGYTLSDNVDETYSSGSPMAHFRCLLTSPPAKKKRRREEEEAAEEEAEKEAAEEEAAEEEEAEKEAAEEEEAEDDDDLPLIRLLDDGRAPSPMTGNRVLVADPDTGETIEAIVIGGNRLFYDGGGVGPLPLGSLGHVQDGGIKRLPPLEVEALIEGVPRCDLGQLSDVLFEWARSSIVEPRQGPLAWVGHCVTDVDTGSTALVWGEHRKQGWLAKDDSRHLIHLLFANGTVAMGRETAGYRHEGAPRWRGVAHVVEVARQMTHNRKKLKMLARAMIR